MTPPTGTAAEPRGRAFLFSDAAMPIVDPKDKWSVALSDRTAAEIRAIWAPGFWGPRVASALAARFEPMARAREQYPGLAVRTMAELFKDVTGRPLEARAKEDTLTRSVFPEILINHVGVEMLPTYRRRVEDLGVRSIATFGRVSTARVQQVVQLGALTIPLPTVAENADYLDLGLLAEARATLTLTKKGGVLSLTLEFVKDGQSVRVLPQIGQALGNAAAVTLASVAWAAWLTNAVASDGLTWFHATHANVQTGAVTEPNVVAAISKLAAIPPLGSTVMLPAPMQPGSVYLVVGPSQWEAARKLNTTLGSALYGLFGEDGRFIIVNPAITDAAWGVHRPADVAESVRMLFVDNEEPEISLADNPSAGALFSHDRYVFKLRHWYGAVVADWRNAVRSSGV